jgi:hypothetical protein
VANGQDPMHTDDADDEVSGGVLGRFFSCCRCC